MNETENQVEQLLKLAESLIYQQTDTYCSELQRQILWTTLKGGRKTYDQLADECGYSENYVKKDVAPKLWHILSQSLDQKVTKANVKAILMQTISQNPAVLTTPTQPTPFPGVSSEAQTPRSHPAASAFPSSSPEKAKILLVDDELKNLQLLSDLLEEEGYELQQAINGTVALQALSLEQPDLILLDIQMPEMDGYTLCQTIKSNPLFEDIPVIFVSALDESWNKVKAFSVGGVDYITKPFKVVEVLARVENQLKIQQLQQRLIDQNVQLQQAILELKRLAAIDDLTQVANRTRFDSYLLKCWQEAAQTQKPMSLILCQLDSFNFYGEGGDPNLGDQLLYQIAQIIKQQVQDPYDLVCRYGTLNFAIVLPGKQQSNCEPIATALLNKVRDFISAGQTAIGVSIGMTSVLPTPETGIEEFLDAGEHNLLQARNQGGNCIVS